VSDTPYTDQDTELDDGFDQPDAEGFETEDGLAPLDAVIAERDEWKDRALRAIAEVENIKRRAETQSNDARAFAIQRFAKDLLGVADNLERGIQAAPRDVGDAAAALVTGMELTQKSLLSAFETNNLLRVAPEAGEAFDPHVHQAMMEQPSDTVQGGQVIQTLQAGYALFGRTIRPAMVVVAAKGSGLKSAASAYASVDANGGNLDEKA
jgi:molecular chaperone GrpE